MVEVQSALANTVDVAIQELNKTPFLERTMYPISVQVGYFDKMDEENEDPLLAKRIRNLRKEYLRLYSEFNQTIFDLDCKAKELIRQYHETRDADYAVRFEKVCKEMIQLRENLVNTDLCYKRQKLEEEIFGS